MNITILFSISVSLLVIYQKRIEKNWVNLISILMGPYVPIVLINNIYAYQKGFDRISDKVLIMILLSFLLFFAGFKTININRVLFNENDNRYRLQLYNFDKMYIFLIGVGILGTIKALILYLQGSFFSDIDEMEGEMGRGLIGHLLLASYSVFPIYFLYLTYNWSIKKIIPIILILVVTFSSFVKYNIIGIFVSTFIFLAIYKKSILTKSIFLLIGFVLFVFYANYAVSFATKGSAMTNDFIINHFWMYLSGSLLHDNYIFTQGVRPGVDVFYKLGTFVFALPNMFLDKLFDTRLFPHQSQEEMSISDFGETSNVVDAIGYLYPSKGDTIDFILFAIVVFLLGVLFSAIYKRHMKISKLYDVFIANFLCYFVFFSFFGTFYINPAPWEILAYSLFIPNFFLKTCVIKKR